MDGTGRLVFFCAKMAAGKSTLAREIAQRDKAVLLVQDEFLAALFPGAIATVQDYITYSTRLTQALEPLIGSLLSSGLTVVLDFPGNTRGQRAWFRRLIDTAGAAHELHWIDAPDDLCKRQLRTRSAHLPDGTPWTTDAEFDAITAYFEPPAPDESFHVVRHERA